MYLTFIKKNLSNNLQNFKTIVKLYMLLFLDHDAKLIFRHFVVSLADLTLLQHAKNGANRYREVPYKYNRSIRFFRTARSQKNPKYNLEGLQYIYMNIYISYGMERALVSSTFFK